MNSVFKLVKNGSCGINVLGLEESNDEYLSFFQDTIRGYTEDHCVTVNTMVQVSYEGKESLEAWDVLLHEYTQEDTVKRFDYIDESTFRFKKDGQYYVSHMLIPNKQWIETMQSYNPDFASNYLAVVYYDNLEFHQIINGNDVVITIDDVLALQDVEESTIVSSSQMTFCMCKLKECYFNLAKQLLTALVATCKNNKYDDLIWRRDMLWMAINVITYLLQKNQFLEAQRILEWITGCGGLCPQEPKADGGRNCGCRKRA